MPDLIQLTHELKQMPDQALQQEMMQPSGVVPGYLLLAEVQRRQLMRQAAEKQQAAGQGQSSVYEDVLRNMMARQPPQGPAPAGMTPVSSSAPPSPGATPPQNFAPPRMMAEGGEFDDEEDDDGGGPYDDLIDQAAARYGERPELLRSMMHVESRGNPKAVSNKGAVGLMQLMPSVASDYGVTDRTDPAQNIDAGAHLLHDLHQRYGDERRAAGAYWFGQGNMAKHGDQLTPAAAHYADLVEQGIPGGFRNLSAAALAPRPFTPPPSPEPPDASGPAAPAGPGLPTVPMGTPPLGPLGPAAPETPPAAAAAPAAPTAPTIDYDTIARQVQSHFPYDDRNTRAEVERLRRQYEKAAAPNLWRTLSDLGWGLAASRGPSWVMQLGQAGQHMSEMQAAREEEYRKQQLQLLGVDVRLDEEARQHQDKLAQITERAVGQAQAQLVRQQTQQQADARATMGNQLKGRSDVRHQLASDPVPQGYDVLADSEHPGWVYTAAPEGVRLTEEQAKMFPGRKAGDWIPNAEFRSAEGRAAKTAAADPLAGVDPNLLSKSDLLQPGQRNEELFKSLAPADRAVVQQLVDYKYPMPTSGMAIRNPEWQRWLQLAHAYDPSFDASQYQPRQKLRNDYLSGKNGQAINSLNTVTEHLDRMEKNWQALSNYGGWGTVLNMPANWLLEMKGDPRVKTFMQDQEAVANELMRVWRQTGAGSEKEIERWKAGLSANASPQEQQGVIREIYQLIAGKMAALKNQYETGMGRPADFHMLLPETAKRFAAHGIDYSDIDPGATYGASAPPAPGSETRPTRVYNGRTYVFDGTKWVGQ